jgi:hypothetical protein
MTIAVVILVALVSTAAGAFLGRWLALREVWREIGEVLDTAAASAGRANVASAKVETISTAWPGVVDRVAKPEADVLRFIPRTQESERQVADVAARMAALEQSIRASLNIDVAGRV